MKLFHSPASPFVRKVAVVLRELDLLDQVEMLATATTPVNTAPELKAANPLGKLPALIDDRGKAIYDSRVICRFLNAKAGGALYPEDGIWDVLTLEATADGIMEAAVLMTYEKRVRPEEKWFDGWIEAQWGKARSAIAHVNASEMDRLNGPLTAAHIGIACALAYVDFRHADRDWRAEAPALAAWYADFSERPAMVDTRPEG